MITGMNESKTITKHISCNCKCKFHGKKYNLNQKWTKHKSYCECGNPIKHFVCKKDYILNPTACAYEDGEILEPTKNRTNFVRKKATCKIHTFYV